MDALNKNNFDITAKLLELIIVENQADDITLRDSYRI